MKRSEAICITVGVFLLTYTGLGFVATDIVKVPITLRQGQTAETTVLRLNPGALRMEAQFKGRGRPELGDSRQEDRTQLAGLQIEVRYLEQEPVRYFADKIVAVARDSVARPLVNVSPGKAAIMFRAGFNRIDMAVISVDPSLEGEAIEVWIAPAIGAKNYEREVGWLLWSIFAPIYLPLYFLWCVVLLWLRQHRRTPPISKANEAR